MWQGKSVSVVLPTCSERDTIRRVINEVFSTGYVDEIVVVNNNAQEGTDQEVLKTKARLVYEKKQGFGYTVQRGLREAKNEYIILSEPDGTFAGQDIIKLLAYSDNFDVVFGTRTTREFIWAGANMGWFLRWGNYIVAKMLELLFNTPSLTDMGCTMRLIKKDALNKIQDRFTVGGSHFNPEFMILVFINKIKAVEIPINYKERAGESTITGNLIKAFFVGLRMIALTISYWFRYKIFRRSLSTNDKSAI